MFLKRLKPGAPDMMQAHSGYEDYPVKIIKNLETKFSEPSFSFYTFTYNRLLYTRRMIESLAENVSSKYQHVIVDQGSSDGTKEYLESLKSRYPKVDWEIVYLKENIGIAEGQKAATQRCNGNILIKIDNDCRVLSRHIDKHLAAIYRLTGLDYVLSPFPLGLIGNLGGVPRVGFEIYYSEDMDRYYTLGLAERIGGLFMCLPRVILDKTGGWLGYSEKYKDPKKHMYDDVYISEKIKGAGFKMAYIENDCAVEHQESTLGQHERYGDGYFKAKF